MLRNTQRDTSDISSHKLSLCSVVCFHVIIASKCHMIKRIENFSGDFTCLASWSSGRAQGRAWTKMVGPRAQALPYLQLVPPMGTCPFRYIGVDHFGTCQLCYSDGPFRYISNSRVLVWYMT